MVAGLQQLMVGPQQGAAALMDAAKRHRRTLTSAATVITATTLAVSARHRRRRPAVPSAKQPRRFLHPLAVHAISGALGEVCEVVTTYPLSTIAVKCQAHGTSTRAVLAELRGLGSRRAGVASLYRGLGASAVVAAMVGAVYLTSFHFFSERLAKLSRRSATARQQRRARHSAEFGGRGMSAAPAAASLAAASQMWAGQPAQAVAPASSTETPLHGSQSATAASAKQHWQQQQTDPQDDLVSVAAAMAMPAAAPSGHAHTQPTSSQGGSQRAREARLSGSSDHGVDGVSHVAAEATAAMLASLGTAFFEGPLEVFQHRAQAGMCGGLGIGRSMQAAFSAGGFRSVFGGYTAFMVKTVPHDVAELLTFRRLAAARGAAPPDGALKTSPLRGLQRLPDEAADMLMGATAGAASVLIAMPLECIKTVIDTGGTPAQGLATLPQFWATGRAIVKANGAGALFRGLAPNMAETVPSAMVYWLAVESCRRALAPYATDTVDSSTS